MDNTSALITSVDIGLQPEQITKLSRMVQRGEASQLSPDKEGGPFMLYIMGDSIDTIATKTSYPIEIIQLTAIYYRWPQKAKSIHDMSVDNGDGDPAMKKVQKDLVNQILIATYMATQKELGDVIAGRKDPRRCRLLPNNIHSLEKLINMANLANSPAVQEVKANTIIQGQNVQVIQNEDAKVKKKDEKQIQQMLEVIEGD